MSPMIQRGVLALAGLAVSYHFNEWFPSLLANLWILFDTVMAILSDRSDR